MPLRMRWATKRSTPMMRLRSSPVRPLSAKKEFYRLDATDRRRLSERRAFVVLDQLGHEFEVVLLVAVECETGKRLDDFHGVVIGGAVVGGPRHLQGN